jgi:hypothetical protein
MPGHDGGWTHFASNAFQTPRDQEPVARGFLCGRSGSFRSRREGIRLMAISKRMVLGLGLAGLIMESIVNQPALAADKVSLFKVITSKDEIVIGLSDAELAGMDGNAGGVAKALVAKGSLSVWQYAVRKAASGDLEQAPLHKVGLISSESLRIEPYATPLKVLPIEAAK